MVTTFLSNICSVQFFQRYSLDIIQARSNMAQKSIFVHSECDTTPAYMTMDKIPIDLYDIGYYEGNWAKFCDRAALYEEYLYYPEHETKKVRLIVCSWIWEQRKITNESIAACALYKYCIQMKPQVDVILKRFLNTFSMNDSEKMDHLVGREKFDVNTPCYNTTMGEFNKRCIAPGNVFHTMFKQIMARACTYEGLTTQTIVSTIEKVCIGNFMAPIIDWKPYYSTIPLKKV